ncbi:Cys-tRNA(Pro) deacylase [Aerococcus kribbianus]|uniref:Cys-tRNA(Pro)/Cys-tRNA(Cys) deacylase n=1 Tax=Aerococcus kribbianus TaxID=2999064 RepID=A0A9X3FM46_9LACT|nr:MULTISPECIES: Cys-tRNA(Pro) deacylase [unclassified Aerococcus]MCZ0717057.1 Cys-tRNA(Pro) deacylase [Aerococcus sp. YH-aer221]MCZ0725345.1 Cys-tRNA(Pro) deacylase [Aerococcus sp. YH-aer222]
MSKKVKTNVMRRLDQAKISYQDQAYFGDDVHNGVEIANKLGNDPQEQFKTLVTQAKSGDHYVFLVPVAASLDLKAAAKAVNEKSVTMIKEKELEPLTGYVHGGCSPIGMKHDFLTTIDDSAQNYEQIIFSAGKVGVSVKVATSDLDAAIKKLQFAPVAQYK